MKSLVESLKINSKSKVNSKVHKDFLPDKYCTQKEICELTNKAFDDHLGFDPEDILDEISQYKNWNELAKAYADNKLYYYKRFEDALETVLINNQRFKLYSDSIIDQVWIHAKELMEEIKD